jgi:hypothetical protein
MPILKVIRETAAVHTARDRVFGVDEEAFETDTGYSKRGNNIDSYTELDYHVQGTGGEGATVTLADELPAEHDAGDFILLSDDAVDDNDKDRLFIGSDETANESIEIWTAKSGPCEITIACSDETTALTVADNKAKFRVPYPIIVSEVRASVSTAPVGADLIVDVVRETGSASIFDTDLLQIDDGDETSTSSASPSALVDPTILDDDEELTFNVDQVGSGTEGAGLKVTIIGRRLERA